MSRASLDKQPHEVAAMFDDVAERYDVTNDVLSMGQDRRGASRRVGRRRRNPASACSTSPPAPARAACRSRVGGATVVPCDFSVGMLKVGKRERPRLPFVAGDATAAAVR